MASESNEQAQFIMMVRNTFNPDKDVRVPAEALWQDTRKNHPIQTINYLLQILSAPSLFSEEDVRGQSAILLRQCLSKARDGESMWSQLGPAQAETKTQLLNILMNESVSTVRKKVADCVQNLVNQTVHLSEKDRPSNLETWPDLLPSMLGLVKAREKDVSLRVDCLWTISEMVVSIWQILIANSANTVDVIALCLSDPSEAVNAQGAGLFCALLENVEKSRDRKPFLHLIESVLAVLARLADSDNPKHIVKLLQAMESTVENPEFIKSLGTLMPALCKVAVAHQDEDARKAAFEVLIEYAEGKPRQVLTQDYIVQALETCIKFMVELDDDIEGWEQENDDEEDNELEDYHAFGKRAIDRLCNAAQKVELTDKILEPLKPHVERFVQSSEWKEAVVGLCIITQIAEYIEDEDIVLGMLRAVKMQFQSPHIRVRHQAWRAIVQLSQDQASVIKGNEIPTQFLPDFITGFDDTCGRNRLQSMEAFHFFAENVSREELEPFVEPLMKQVSQKLRSTPECLKHAITIVSVIAGQVGDFLAPWYDDLIPVLKQVIEATIHKVEERTLLGKTFECISLLSVTVGKERFSPDVSAIMQAMIQAVKAPDLPSDDPVKEYVMAAAERICETMKDDFLPFVQDILSFIVLEKLSVTPRELNSEAVAENMQESEMSLALLNVGEGMKIMMMETAGLEDLQHALECIFKLAYTLGKKYAPFLGQTAQALVPVFDFSMQEEVRQCAFETWGQLCEVAKEEGQAETLIGLLSTLLNSILPKFESEPDDIEALKSRADGIACCLCSAGPNVLSAAQVNQIGELTLKQVQASLLRTHPDRTAANEDADADDNDSEESEDEDERGLQISLTEVAGVLMEHHPQFFLPLMERYLVLMEQLFRPEAAQDDRKLAVLLALEICEHLGSSAVEYWPRFLDQVIEDIQHKSPELRVPACGAISHAAKEPKFADGALSVALKLKDVVIKSRAAAAKKTGNDAEGNHASADNALSGLVQILLHHEGSLAGHQEDLLNVWMKGLPCKQDEDEAKRNHAILLRLLVEENPVILGKDNANLPKLLQILVEVYKTDFIDDETSEKVGKLCLSLGEERLNQCAMSFPAKWKTKLLRIVREARQAL